MSSIEDQGFLQKYGKYLGIGLGLTILAGTGLAYLSFVNQSTVPEQSDLQNELKDQLMENIKQKLFTELEKKQVSLETFFAINQVCCLSAIPSNTELVLKHREERRRVIDTNYQQYIDIVKNQQKIEQDNWELRFNETLNGLGMTFELFSQLYIQFIQMNPAIRDQLFAITRSARKNIKVDKPKSEKFNIEFAKDVLQYMIEKYHSIEVPLSEDVNEINVLKRKVLFDMIHRDFDGFEEEYFLAIPNINEDEEFSDLNKKFVGVVQRSLSEQQP